jgi:uncharacterized protein
MHTHSEALLSKSERRELAERLAAFPGAMSISAARGLFAALGSVPEVVRPLTWLSLVLGEEWNPFESATKRTVGLVVRLYKDTLGQLARAARSVLPAAEDVDAISEWCWGYTRGVELNDFGFDELSVEAWDALWVIEDLAGSAADGEPPPPGSDEAAYVAKQGAGLYGMVMCVYRDWARARASGVPDEAPPPRPTGAVGRNDPCPCGSGKKYKKCCAH